MLTFEMQTKARTLQSLKDSSKDGFFRRTLYVGYPLLISMWSSSWWLWGIVKLTTIIVNFRRLFCRVHGPLLSLPSSSQIIFPFKLILIYCSKGIKGSLKLSTKFIQIHFLLGLCADLLTIIQSRTRVYMYMLHKRSFFEHLLKF